MTEEAPTGPAASTQSSDELAVHIRTWRKRVDLNTIDGINRKTRRRTKLSQERAAALIGCSVGWYRRLEAGEQHNWSASFLNRVAKTLQLTPDEKTMLYLLTAADRDPLNVTEPPNRTTGLESLIDTIHALPWPAYINNDAWDLIAYNQHMANWFPWVTTGETNVMRWVFTYPEATTQLHNWKTEWAPQMLAQMRAAHALKPHNERLTEVINEILEVNDIARDLWDDPMAYIHPDGDRRSLFLPYHRHVQQIHLIALGPLRAPEHRVMYLVPC